MAYTRLSVTATPGRNYGSFSSGGTTHSGAATLGLTFAHSSSGILSAIGTSTLPIAFSISASANRTLGTTATSNLVLGQSSSGILGTSGSSTVSITFAIPQADGSLTAIGNTTAALIFGTSASATTSIIGNTTAALVFGISANGTASLVGNTTANLTFNISNTGTRDRSALSTANLVFGQTSSGLIIISGSVTADLAFGQSSSGIVVIVSSATADLIFNTNALGTYKIDHCRTPLITEFNRQLDLVHGYFDHQCRLYYPPILVDCPNCATGPGNQSSNRYMHGAPIPLYSRTKCSMCGGSGKRSKENYDNVNLGVYFNNASKQFTKSYATNDNGIMIPRDVVTTRGLLVDLTKFIQANYLLVNVDQYGIITRRYKKLSEPKLHGLNNRKYIVTEWIRDG